MFALVDCNSFYASCEKIFRPDLTKKPVIVLSNNDGCVIARSPEAKKMGVAMGQPWFQVKNQYLKSDGIVFSSNYELYADISNRVMNILGEICPEIDIYSIDEAFLDLRTFEKNIDLVNKRAINHYLKATPVEKIWGVGKRLSLKLKDLGVDNAFNLTQVRSRLIGDRFNVVLERTVRELKSQKCLDSNNIMEPKKQIMVSRSFGKSIRDKRVLKEAISFHASRAAEKLRYENQKCRIITVFIRSNRYNKKISQIYASEYQQLAHPTNDSRIIIKIANNLMEKIYAEGYLYSKAGILLSDFTDSYGYQTDLFNDNYDSKESEILMSVIDFINLREIAKIGFGNQGYENTWRMKREMKSRRYTTKIEQIPIAK